MSHLTKREGSSSSSKVDLETGSSESTTDLLNLQIQEGGENLSSGEKSLLCICRAILRKNKVVTVTDSTGYDEIYLLVGDNMQVEDGQMATPSENAKNGEIPRLFTSTLKGNRQSRILLNKFISQVA